MSNAIKALLKGIYSSLIESGNQEFYIAQPISGYPWARLALKDGCLAIITPSTNQADLFDIELEHIKVQFDLEVSIKTDDKTEIERVSIIECKSSSPWLLNTFLDFMSMVFLGLDSAKPVEINAFVQDLINLFRSLTQISSKSVQGLWGELFVISQSLDPTVSVLSWHSTPNDRYDFAKLEERIEVKTTTGIRRHSFAHEQISINPGLQVFIASLILNQDAEGVSCAGLIENILPRLKSAESRQSLISKSVRTLGLDWRSQDSLKFDTESAKIALKWYDVASIPKIANPLPAHIYALKYQCDLQTTAELSLEELRKKGPLMINFTHA
jgi:hypothetical protein